MRVEINERMGKNESKTEFQQKQKSEKAVGLLLICRNSFFTTVNSVFMIALLDRLSKKQELNHKAQY